MILDSDIIIYSALPQSEYLRDFIESNLFYYSAVSQIEVLGFHRISDYDAKYFAEFFASLTVIAISEQIISRAISLRQRHKINLGDSVIAASALEYNLALVTNNRKDFDWIDDLSLINPLENE